MQIEQQDVITTQDVENFAVFLAMSHQLHFEKMPPQAKEKLKKKALYELKRISVQLKVAKNFMPSPKELQKTLELLAMQNDVALSQMKDVFVKAKIPWSLFEKKIQAQLAWSHYVRNRFGSIVQPHVEDIKPSKEVEYELYEITVPTSEQALSHYKNLMSLRTLEERRSYILKETREKGYWGWVKKPQIPRTIMLPTRIGDVTKPIALSPTEYRIIFLADTKAFQKGPMSTIRGSFIAVTIPKNIPRDLEYDFIKRQFDVTKDPKIFQDLGEKLGGHVEKLENISFLALNLSPQDIERLLILPVGSKITFSKTVQNTPVEQVMWIVSKQNPEAQKTTTIDWESVKLSQLGERELDKHMKMHGN